MLRMRALLLAGLAGLSWSFTGGELCADESKASRADRPPWQRYLQGEDARRATEQAIQLAHLQEAGQFAEALKVAEVLAELRGKAQGAEHWHAVNARSAVEAVRRVLRQPSEVRQEYAAGFALVRQAVSLRNGGRYHEAQPLFEKALALRLKVLGEEHADTADSYNDLAMNLNAQGKYREAEESFQKGLAIRRKVLGEDHPDTARSYNNLAGNRNAQGKYAEAEESLRNALAIRRKVLGEEHPETVEIYNNAAMNLHAQGKYKEAEASYRKALGIWRKMLGEGHLHTASTYNNLANTLKDQGKLKEAEECLRKALAIRRKVLGEDHPYTAQSCDNLAFILYARGEHEAAAAGFRKALAIRRKVLGEEHPDTASSYLNLAINLNSQGDYAKAEEGFRRALAIYRKVLGEEHPATASSYDNLAVALDAQSRYEEAGEAFRRALAIRRKVLGEEHPLTSASLNNTAMNLNSQGKHEEAGEAFRRALAIRRKGLGEEHPLTAKSYHNLAIALDNQGKYKEGEELLRKALTILRKVPGEQHLDTAQGYNDVAFNLNAQGRYAEAEQYWLRGTQVFTKSRLHLAASGLERATVTSERSPLPLLAAVLARNGKPNDAWQRWEESLGRGTWDDLSTRLRRPPAEQAEQSELAIRLSRLDQLIERTFSAKADTDELKKRRGELLTQRRQTQAELDALAQHLEKTYGPAAGQVFKHQEIQAALPPDTALIGWLDRPGAAKAADPNGEHWAVLLRAAGDPVWVRLQGSGDKDAWTDADSKLTAELRAALQSPRGAWRPLARRLGEQRLKPLTKHLDGLRRLIVLPSTALAGVPVEVFADGYLVSYAPSGTLYAHLRNQPKLTTKGLLALADPVFDPPNLVEKPLPLPPGGILLTMVAPRSIAALSGLRPNDVLLRYNSSDLAGPADLKTLPPSKEPGKPVTLTVWRDGKTFEKQLPPGKLGVVVASEPAPQALAAQRKLDRRLTSASRGGGDQWQQLPGTRAEAAALIRLFGEKQSPLRVLSDSQASEQQLYALAANGELDKYRYLHLATHGLVDDRSPLRSAVVLSRDALPDAGKQLDAGLPVFDGQLTAREVLEQWHLNSDLVTLSACQTALGKYERGEGFVGFAQALILAGSRSVCLSLWKVDDAATALLMERFYQNLLGKREGLKAPMAKAQALAEAKAWLRGLSREDALKRAAQLSSGVARGKGRKMQPLLPEVPAGKDEQPYAHPYYWAAFVLIGDPD